GASAAFYPALLVLTAIAGCTLAWRWYHLLAARPVGPVGSRFREFRFSDQAIWLLVGALAVSLLPIRGISIFGAPLGDWAGNLLVVMVALYVARGLAVFVAASARSPGRIVAELGVVALFLWPFAVGGLVLLGLADSWVDFRRRLESPPTGGLERGWRGFGGTWSGRSARLANWLASVRAMRGTISFRRALPMRQPRATRSASRPRPGCVLPASPPRRRERKRSRRHSA